MKSIEKFIEHFVGCGCNDELDHKLPLSISFIFISFYICIRIATARFLIPRDIELKVSEKRFNKKKKRNL